MLISGTSGAWKVALIRVGWLFACRFSSNGAALKQLAVGPAARMPRSVTVLVSTHSDSIIS